ncbi:MAG: type II toxin-antitoxin system prevent-host-death family antitoxin [Desulfosalsimonadaceae bacterium]
MNTAGIKDIKNNLSRYLARVKSGEEILITERGRPIARIIRENGKTHAIRQTLGPLIERGLVAMPTQPIHKEPPARIKATGKSTSEMVGEDRR